MNTFETRQQEFVDNINEFEFWNEKFDYLIELSPELPDMPKHLMTAPNQLLGCQSKTYFCAKNVEGTLRVWGWSNSIVMCGLLAAMFQMFDGVPVSDITADNITFHTQTDLNVKMTPQRVGGLLQIIERIKRVCLE